MPQSELQTLVLDKLRDLQQDFDRRTDSITQSQTRQAETLKALEARQAESEMFLTRLSELYTRLTPLIDSINSTVNNG
ncbi:MAG: hypothetical protein LBP22_03310 [Deltaproteobacteria bacterium]|jgi:hypothetical protein|nr:hypothetical protein [Deltaproteobacteria bacterium]